MMVKKEKEKEKKEEKKEKDKRGRVKIEVDKNKLISIVNKVEEGGPLPSLSILYSQIAQSEWGRSLQLTDGVVRLRIKEHNITTKTTKGKRGILSLSPEHIQKMREARGRKKDGKKLKEFFDITELKKSTPPSFYGVIKKISKGSFTAAIKLKCLECSGYDKVEVRFCLVKNCALWNFRPYKPKKCAECEGELEYMDVGSKCGGCNQGH